MLGDWKDSYCHHSILERHVWKWIVLSPGMILTQNPDNPTVQNVPFSSPLPHPSTCICSSGKETVFIVTSSQGLVLLRLLERMRMSRSQDASISEAFFQAVRLPELLPWRHRWQQPSIVEYLKVYWVGSTKVTFFSRKLTTRRCTCQPTSVCTTPLKSWILIQSRQLLLSVTNWLKNR